MTSMYWICMAALIGGSLAWAYSIHTDSVRLRAKAKMGPLEGRDDGYWWVQRHTLRLLPVALAAGLVAAWPAELNRIDSSLFVTAIAFAFVFTAVSMIALAAYAKADGLFRDDDSSDDRSESGGA